MVPRQGDAPLEAWNEDGIKLILGDVCIFDRLDSHTASRETRDTSQFLTCWVWMDALPKAMEYWYFATKAMEYWYTDTAIRSFRLGGRQPAQTRPPRNGGCRAPVVQQLRHDRDHDGPRRHHDVPRSTRARQLFPGCASDRSVRVQSRSPHPYRRAAEMVERGRASSRSPLRTLRSRDSLPRSSEDWERRRSHGPLCATTAQDDILFGPGVQLRAVPIL